MFDDTLTLQKVKFAIGNDYAFFGYTDDIDFETTIETLADASKFDLLQYISEDEYDRIAALTYSTMELEDQYVFMAEVYNLAAKVVNYEGEKELQNRLGYNDSLSVEGYSRSVSGTSGKSKSAFSLNMLYLLYLQRAGYTPLKLERA
jgi:hypothetical protein